eukprot:TRINITY_DN948_c0_g6_i1.p1 TRINITY_DN948_c0_g6~~TRINITY_DN948_c0_g6_i1.p1  ORF type:complete len:190 (-),score=65.62 TRINITY_DN948_c0_g6_i1:118-687(-)
MYQLNNNSNNNNNTSNFIYNSISTTNTPTLLTPIGTTQNQNQNQNNNNLQLEESSMICYNDSNDSNNCLIDNIVLQNCECQRCIKNIILENKRKEYEYNKTIEIQSNQSSKLTLFICGLEKKMKERDIKKYYPKAIKITVPMNKNGLNKKYAFVQFDNLKDYNLALNEENKFIIAKPLKRLDYQLEQQQ